MIEANPKGDFAPMKAAFEAGDLDEISRIRINREVEMTWAYKHNNLHELAELLRLMSDRSGLYRHHFIQTERDKMLYEIGRIEGYSDAIRDIYRHRYAEEELRKLLEDPYNKSIFLAVAEHGVINHPSLAQELGIEYHELATMMKPFIKYQIITPEHVGPRTSYQLAPYGYQYYKRVFNESKTDPPE